MINKQLILFLFATTFGETWLKICLHWFISSTSDGSLADVSEMFLLRLTGSKYISRCKHW